MSTFDQNIKKRFNVLISFSPVLAFWENEKITNDEMQETVKDFWSTVHSLSSKTETEEDKEDAPENNDSQKPVIVGMNHRRKTVLEKEGWQSLVEKEHHQVWRRPLHDSGLYI